MVSFSYVIRDELGIHARPAGMLAKLASTFQSKIVIDCPGGSADAKRLISIMKLGTQKGDTAAFTIEGDDEEAAAAALEKFMQENL